MVKSVAKNWLILSACKDEKTNKQRMKKLDELLMVYQRIDVHAYIRMSRMMNY